MLRKGFYAIALTAVLVPLAAAQNYKVTPKPTIQDYGPFKNMPYRNTTTKAAPGTCGNPAKACLFYGGDFFFSPFYASIANGLGNETTLFVPGAPYGAAVWVPFTVPAGQTWFVTGLFSNNQSTYGVLDQGVEPTSVALWSINEGVFPGNAGTVVASGTSPATSTPTGRSAFGYLEFTVQVTGLSVALSPGSYWMAVVPICTNTANPFCNDVFFESDVEYINTTPTNAYNGQAQPLDAAFFDSPYFGESFQPAYSPAGACGGFGCDAFSAGVLGKAVK